MPSVSPANDSPLPSKKKGIFKLFSHSKHKSNSPPTPSSTPNSTSRATTPAPTADPTGHSPGLIKKIARAATADHIPIGKNNPITINTAAISKGSTTSQAPHSKLHSPSPGTPVRRASTSIRPSPFIDAVGHLGKGTDIAGARHTPIHNNSPTNHSIYANTNPTHTQASSYSIQFNHNKIATNGTTTSSGYDKKHVLPLPLVDPNTLLDPSEQQKSSKLFEEYCLPDSGPWKDRKLGNGASACVFAVVTKSTAKPFAFKKFVFFSHETPEEFYARAIKEFKIAKKLSSNKHIVQTYSCQRDSMSNIGDRSWGFIMDICTGGDLFSLIARSGWKASPTAEKWCIFKQIAIGCKFIHENGIVHRDLKPENVLLDEHGCCKITDFGVADFAYDIPQSKFNALDSFLNPDHDDDQSDSEDSSTYATEGVEFYNGFPVKMSTAFVGSPPYVPPEVTLCKGNRNPTPYNPFKIDSWSLGMILFCLVYQNTPFTTTNPAENSYREYVSMYKGFIQQHPQFRTSIKEPGPGIEYRFGKEFPSGGASRVAFRLADINASTRMTLDQLFVDPWFVSIETCQDESFHNITRHTSVHRSDSLINNDVNSASSTTHIIKPKSMLDLTVAPAIAAAPITGAVGGITTGAVTPASPAETAENLFLKTDLPTLAEDNDEDQPNFSSTNNSTTPPPPPVSSSSTAPSQPPSPKARSRVGRARSTSNTRQPPPAVEPIVKRSTMCDFGAGELPPAHVPSSNANIFSPTPSSIAANLLNHKNSLMSSSNYSIHSTIGSSNITTNNSTVGSYHDERSSSTHSSANGTSSMLLNFPDSPVTNTNNHPNLSTMNRASSFSSINSTRSQHFSPSTGSANGIAGITAAGSSSSIGGGSSHRRQRHHHLDIINVQHKSTFGSIKR